MHHFEKPSPTINQRKDEPYEVRAVEPIAHAEAAPAQHAPVAHVAVEHAIADPHPVHREEPRTVSPPPTPVKADYEQDDLDVPAFLRKKRTE
jgi:hypothetical protein